MYQNMNLKKLAFTRGETVSKCRHARKTRRCGGAFSLLLPLVFATAMLLHTPVVKAVEFYRIVPSETDPFCQLASGISSDVFKLPGLGGSYLFQSIGNLMVGKSVGAARLYGEIVGGGGTFYVDILLDDILRPGDVGYADVCRNFAVRDTCASPDKWRVFTTLTGTLTGLTGTLDGTSVSGAVYNVTLRETGSTCTENDPATNPTPALQIGAGSNTHNSEPGFFAQISYVLADPAAYPDLPVGPFNGEVSGQFTEVSPIQSRIAPSPDLIGTWEGVIECAGVLDFTDVETIFSPMTLKVGLDARYGRSIRYEVELSDAGDNVVANYCAEYTIDPRGSQILTGWMTSSNPGQTMMLLKVRKDDSDIVTLKARELFTIPDGGDNDLASDGQDFCKWSFTQTNTASPAITTVCPPYNYTGEEVTDVGDPPIYVAPNDDDLFFIGW